MIYNIYNFSLGLCDVNIDWVYTLVCAQTILAFLTKAKGRREAYHGFSFASPDLAVTTHV